MYRYRLLATFVCAFAILVSINVRWIANNEWFDLPAKPFSDGPDYESMAWGLAHGIGLSSHFGNPQWQQTYLIADPEIYDGWEQKTGPIVPRTDRPPLLSVCIAGIYLVLGSNQTAYVVVRIFLAICLSLAGAIAVVMSQHIWDRIAASSDQNISQRWRITMPFLASAFCLLIAVFDNNVKRYMEDFLTELPAFALTQIFAIAVFAAMNARQPRWAIVAAGVLFALMSYARSLFILWMPGLCVLLFVLFWISYQPRVVHEKTMQPNGLKGAIVSLKQTVLFASVVLLCLSPWLVRNCLVLQTFMPLGTKGPVTLMGGYCDESFDAGGDWRSEPELYWRKVERTSFGTELDWSTSANIVYELEMVRIARQEIKAWINQNWSKIPRLIAGRIWIHFNPYSGKSGIAKLLAAIGAIIVIYRAPRYGIFLVGMIAINATVVAGLYSVGGRFLVPLYGVMYVFAAIGCTGLLSIGLSKMRRYI